MRSFFPVLLGIFLCSFSINAAPLQVLSYNAWGAPVAGKNAKERMPLIAAELSRLDADIVALQEAFEGCLVGNFPDTILRGSRYPFYVKGPSARGMKCVNSGLLILSKYPISESAEIVYHRCTGMDCFSRKGMVYARVHVPSIGPVDVYATHTNSGKEDPEIRESQVDQIIPFVQKHSGDGERPILLMGDLNATPDSAEIQKLMKSLDLRDLQPEFIRGRSVSEIERNGYTADPARNLNLADRLQQPPKRIDYLLFREARFQWAPVQVNEFGMIFQDVGFQGRQLSDHFGIRGTIDIPNRVSVAGTP